MKSIIIPESYNYIAAFLTLDCNYHCSYCINSFGGFKNKGVQLCGKEWVRGLNRIVAPCDLPVTLQGGEPSLHKDFIYIINNLKPELRIDILTNLQFDVKKFIRKVSPQRLKKKAPYASIRVTFHPECMDLTEVISKAAQLQEAGFSIGVYGILHPHYHNIIRKIKLASSRAGIDFRTKEFLGVFNGRLYGTYRYTGACANDRLREVVCKTTELIIGPEGAFYRCHSDLYAGREPIGSLFDDDFSVCEAQIPCSHFGSCHPCDVKIKTNRFQRYGHTSVAISKL